MARVIILEGPDGAGKTTLARHLESDYGYRYHHEGVPAADTDLLVHYARVLDRAIRSNERIVIDRLYLGESVYGPLLRKLDRIGEMGQVILQRIVRGGGVLEVFCMPPERVCYGNWFKRNAVKGELVDNTLMFQNVYAAYEKLRKHPRHSRALHYDYTKWNLDDACAMLTSEMNNPPALPEGVIGSPEGSFLFVGEVANQEALDLPWVALGNSSNFLNNALHEAGYAEEEMMFMNVKHLDGSYVNLVNTIDVINASNLRTRAVQVVSLGSVAYRRLHFQGYGSRTKKVPHPAYWKRFHARDTPDYVKKLRDIRLARYAEKI